MYARAVSVVCCLLASLYGEGFESRHAREVAKNPHDIRFRLALSKSTIHMGERISLALEFSSESPNTYKLNGATYDRSGRLPTEEFVMEQSGVKDPYEDYFGTGVLGFMGGGLRSYPVLESKPYTIELTLNDWFRFDHPGRYRFYVKSHRLSRERAPGDSGDLSRRTVEFAVTSEIVELELLAADSGWEASKLTEIRSMLDRPVAEMPKPGGPPVPQDPLEDEMRSARKDL